VAHASASAGGPARVAAEGGVLNRCLRDAPARAKTPNGKVDPDKLPPCPDGRPRDVVQKYNEFIRNSNDRQLDRYLQDFFETFTMVGGGWRAATVHLRIKLAVMFLSAEGVSVAEVARAVGYGSSDAMARAFRDAGLSAPTTLREALQKSA